MEEKFKREVLTRLSTALTAKELKEVDTVISLVLTKYDLDERATEIVIYRDGLPSEIQSFLVCKSIEGLVDSTLRLYRLTLTNFALNIKRDIKEMTTNDIRVYMYTYELTHKIGKSALDDIRRILNSFYTWLVREDIVEKNPMVKIDPIKCEKPVREPLTDLELERMRNACETLREKAIFETLYSTGCRVSELTAMNRQDINYSDRRIKVFGKGKKERWCFLNAKSQLALKKYIFSRADNGEAIFVAGKKPYNRLSKGTVEKEIKTLGERAGISRRVFPHLVRHTTATNMLDHGAGLADVQALLGHESPETTVIYAKTNYRKLQAVHERCII
jgi:integrase/recombinase XerD